MATQSDKRLDSYLANMHKVQGWLQPLSARAIGEISKFQIENGIRGSVAEIGVHHGKLFLVLFLTRYENEVGLAIDVFDEQHLNVDGSGLGDEGIFIKNVKKWAGSTDGLRIIKGSSLNLTPSAIIEPCSQPVRLFSIDGSHTAEATLNDLHLAQAAITTDGVAILDDCFNENWPGVVTAVSKFMHDGRAEVTPFAISPNKVYLARKHMHQTYVSALLDRVGYKVKKSSFFGHEVTIFGQPRTLLQRALGRLGLS